MPRGRIGVSSIISVGIDVHPEWQLFINGLDF